MLYVQVSRVMKDVVHEAYPSTREVMVLMQEDRNETNGPPHVVG